MNDLFINPGDIFCPRCGTSSPIDIVYGTPSGEMLDAEDAGNIVLGGVAVADDLPTHQCRHCEASWQMLD